MSYNFMSIILLMQLRSCTRFSRVDRDGELNESLMRIEKIYYFVLNDLYYKEQEAELNLC